MKRPFGVTLIGILLLVQGLYLVALVAAAIFLKSAPSAGRARVPLAVDFSGLAVTNWPTAVVAGALGVVIIVAGVGVLRLHPWAWLAAMVLQGWTLAALLFNYFTRGRSSYPTMLLGAVIVFYLNSRTVRHTFDLVRQREAAAETSEPPPPAYTSAAAEITAPRPRVVVSDAPAEGRRERSAADG